MDRLSNIFRTFCKYVDERIFPEENAGTYVAFVVDQSFVDEFCKIHSIKESLLMSAVRSSLYDWKRDSLFVKGILAIQLFAASKRANDGYITEKNYRDRLSQVLNWDMNDLQSWMIEYQEDTWDSLYTWCDRHFFQIAKCERKTGTGRYVQYPVNQALRVFTDEDLKYIALCFIERNLLPGEDIQKRDFKRLISRYDIQHTVRTNHARLVIANSITEDDYYNQVYNYYLRWNGEYKERTGKHSCIVKKDTDQLYMYLPDDFTRLELRTSNLSLVKKFDLSVTSYDILAKNYNFKRKGVILFKRDDIYENYWQETRYLEGMEEGIVLCYNQKDSCVHYKLSSFLISRNKYVQIFRVSYNFYTKDFYSNKRFYELYGGLKIGRQMYLLGAAPTLRLERPTRIWIDGKSYADCESKGDVFLTHLSEGRHYITIPGYKKIEFEIQNPNANICDWMNDYNQWHIDKDKNLWENNKEGHGIVGLDYSSIPQKLRNMDVPTLRRWSNQLTFGHNYKGESNITLRIIKQVEL